MGGQDWRDQQEKDEESGEKRQRTREWYKCRPPLSRKVPTFDNFLYSTGHEI